MRKVILSSALILALAACGHGKNNNEAVTPAAPPPPAVVKVNGEVIPQSDIDAIATELSLTPGTDEATDAAIYVTLLKAYAAKNEIPMPEGTANLSETVTQLENAAFDKAPPPPPADEPYIKVDHAYLFLDKVTVKADKKKSKPSAEAFRKEAVSDPSKTFMTIFEEQKLKGAYWHVADDEFYPARFFPWLPADLPVGEVSEINVTPEAYELIRLKERIEPKYEDHHAWLAGYLTSQAEIEK